jgi:hypothetical protein
VQGWLGGTTPIPGSPGRAQRRVRVIHGSSLSIHVRPFAPCRRLLWPLLTSVRSRRKSLPAALCRFPVCCLFARLRLATRRNAWALMIQLRPFWKYGSARHRYARQISPGKNAMFPCTSAAFTLSAAPTGFATRCQLARRPGLLCNFCPSPRTFALRLPPDNPSRACPCLRLVVIIDS